MFADHEFLLGDWCALGCCLNPQRSNAFVRLGHGGHWCQAAGPDCEPGAARRRAGERRAGLSQSMAGFCSRRAPRCHCWGNSATTEPADKRAGKSPAAARTRRGTRHKRREGEEKRAPGSCVCVVKYTAAIDASHIHRKDNGNTRLSCCSCTWACGCARTHFAPYMYMYMYMYMCVCACVYVRVHVCVC